MILVLGGTRDAHKVALALQADGIEFTVSLAGVTRGAPVRNYPVRTGGFGGAAGLAEYLGKKGITGVIDATHPFAVKISTSAAASGVPVLRFDRPAWTAPDGADWVDVATLEEVAQVLPSGARAFLSVGSGSLAPFIAREDVWFLYRGIEPSGVVFAQGEALLQRPPFTLEGELGLMRRHEITHLVTKNSGGDKTYAKIEAATKLKIPIIAVERPVLPVVEGTQSIPDVVRWANKLGNTE